MNKKELEQLGMLVNHQVHLLKVCPLITEDKLVINNEDLSKVAEKLDIALDAISDVLKLENKAIDIILKGEKNGRRYRR